MRTHLTVLKEKNNTFVYNIYATRRMSETHILIYTCRFHVHESHQYKSSCANVMHQTLFFKKDIFQINKLICNIVL
jgi:hypothetical protein